MTGSLTKLKYVDLSIVFRLSKSSASTTSKKQNLRRQLIRLSHFHQCLLVNLCSVHQIRVKISKCDALLDVRNVLEFVSNYLPDSEKNKMY